MGNFLGPGEMNSTCRKATCMGTRDTGFTLGVIVVLWNAINIQTINYELQGKHCNTESSHSAIWSLESEADIFGISLQKTYLNVRCSPDISMPPSEMASMMWNVVTLRCDLPSPFSSFTISPYRSVSGLSSRPSILDHRVPWSLNTLLRPKPTMSQVTSQAFKRKSQ